jgi:hypothetical protein
MKKVIGVLILSLVLIGCKKKNCDCGEVMDKNIDYQTSSSGTVIGTHYHILFHNSCPSESRWVTVSEELYNSLGIGDIYCIP